MLEQKEIFPEHYQPIIDSLTKKVGLHPYVNSDNLSYKESIGFEFNRPLNMDEEDIVFHEVQAKVYRKLLDGENVILSAPTSFGKSLIIDSIIASIRYDNIVIIVPTIALIDETRKRLKKYSHTFKIITQQDQSPSEKNVFIFTQERALAYGFPDGIDFFIIDEFYKLNADTHKKDQDRSYLLNQIFYKLYKTGAQFYMLGPNIENITAPELSAFFIRTDFETVVTEVEYISPKPDAMTACLKLCKRLKEPTIIYCKSPNSLSKIVSFYLDSGYNFSSSTNKEAAIWLSENYHPDWIFAKALENGIGIHHGKIPRSLAQYVVSAFNDREIKILFCTSTLIEGVNTAAKNVVVYDNKIANKKLDFFTFNNIKGRSGRMKKHFVGKVFIMEEEPEMTLPFVDVPALSQNDATPEELLIHIEKEDLTPESKERLKYLHAQDILDVDIIKMNYGVTPENQINLAIKINENLKTFHKHLYWNGFPNKSQLLFSAKIIWDDLKASKHRGGILSYKQLCYYIIILRNSKSVSEFISLMENKKDDINKTISNVLDFMRSWANFHYPKYLLSLQRIQEYVFSRNKLPYGDYSVFAAKVENLFLPEALVSLEEYGIPIQLSQKLQSVVNFEQSFDAVLEQLKNLDIKNAPLHNFERRLFHDFIKT